MSEENGCCRLDASAGALERMIVAVRQKGEKMQGMVTLEKKGIKIVITHMPYRKKPCLAVQIDNCITKVASFNSEVEADWFIEILEEMFVESGKKE